MKTIEEMENEENEVFATLWVFAGQKRERLLTSTMQNAIIYLVLCLISVLWLPEIVVAFIGFTGIFALSLNILTLGFWWIYDSAEINKYKRV